MKKVSIEFDEMELGMLGRSLGMYIKYLEHELQSDWVDKIEIEDAEKLREKLALFCTKVMWFPGVHAHDED